ncbi:MAG: trimeric intracellular cation channel family protein [Clostridia bacterium]|nr:trimeric intracellular cation channel family protein [Clostridia bacterium]
MSVEIILLVLEIVGTVAFAVSGAFVAVKARFDIFGVIVIGCITAVGGGITRDLLIGAFPPAIFSRSYIVGIAALTSTLAFLFAYFHRKKFDETLEKIERINNVFDAIGLAAFTVMGTELAFVKGFSDNVFLSITLGVLTGVGGGVLRDILTETPPYIFKKHIYAIASIGGGALYYILRLFTDGTLIPSAVATFFIILVRMLATKYRWSLPKVRLEEERKALPLQTERKDEERKAS